MILETATQAHLRSAGSVPSIYRGVDSTLSHLRIPMWDYCTPFVGSVEFDLFSWKFQLQNPNPAADDRPGPAWGYGVSSPFSSGTSP